MVGVWEGPTIRSQAAHVTRSAAVLRLNYTGYMLAYIVA